MADGSGIAWIIQDNRHKGAEASAGDRYRASRSNHSNSIIMSLLGNAFGNFTIFVKRTITKIFVHEVVFSARNGKIASQVRNWKAKRNVFLLDSYYHKALSRAKSYEIVWYVEENSLTRWCGLANYKSQRHVVNQLITDNVSRSNNKRKTG